MRGLMALIAGWSIITAVSAQAANFAVSPVGVTLADGERSHLITVTNQGSDSLRFQLKAYRWEQHPDGQILQAPTEDVIFFPRLFEVPAHEIQYIRVGVVAPAMTNEKTYRLEIRQLKPFEANAVAAQRSEPTNITLLTDVNIPVFVEPALPATQPGISGLTLRNGTLSFTVVDSGNIHFRIASLEVEGFGASEQPTLSKKAAVGYVLANGSRNYELALSKSDCARINRLRLSMETDHGKVHRELAVSEADCGRP